MQTNGNLIAFCSVSSASRDEALEPNEYKHMATHVQTTSFVQNSNKVAHKRFLLVRVDICMHVCVCVKKFTETCHLYEAQHSVASIHATNKSQLFTVRLRGYIHL